MDTRAVRRDENEPASGPESPLEDQQRSGLRASVSMQLCYRNDAASDTEDDPDEASSDAAAARLNNNSAWLQFRRPPKSLQICPLGSLAVWRESTASERHRPKHNRRPLEPELLAACSALNDLLITADMGGGSGGMIPPCSSSIDRMSAQQARLKAEAELALAQAKPMARMQLQVERQSTLHKLCLLSKNLCEHSVSELRELNTCLRERVNGLNDELVGCLIERDALNIEQDSMLVEVEDLTRRARELAERLSKSSPTESRD